MTIKLFIILLTFFASTHLVAASADCQKLSVRWESEEIYFVPKNESDSRQWNGYLYDSLAKKCFISSEKLVEKKPLCTLSETPCDQALKAKAEKPYFKESSFPKFIDRFKKCQGNKDAECLSEMIAKTAQISFGHDGFSDRRDAVVNIMLGKHYDYTKKALKKLKYRSESPSTQIFGDEGMGLRGQFQLVDGSWRLMSYLAGD